MSKRKINATNCIKLTAITTSLSLGVGATSSYFLSAMYPRHEISAIGCMLFAWTVPHSWILLAGVDSLREELGFKSPVQVAGNWTKRAFGRKIPVNAGDKSGNIFMQTLSLNSGKTVHIAPAPVELETISVWYNENSYTLTMADIEEFLYVAWRKQGQNKNGFSRDYWTKRRRPRLKTLEYNVRIVALTACEGLIIDRHEGRSGRLSVPPNEAMQIIRSVL